MDILDSGSLKIQYNRNRYYDYYTGRFTTHDPLAIDVASVPGDAPTTVLQQFGILNLYEYANSRPMGVIDSWGLYGADVHCVLTRKWATNRALCFANYIGWWDAGVDRYTRHPIVSSIVGSALTLLGGGSGAIIGPILLNRTAYWHFPGGDVGQSVDPGGPLAKREIEKGIKRCNLKIFSEGLHQLQDSYSHQSGGQLPPWFGKVAHSRDRHGWYWQRWNDPTANPFARPLAARAVQALCLSRLPFWMCGRTRILKTLRRVLTLTSTDADKFTDGIFKPTLDGAEIETKYEMNRFRKNCPCIKDGPFAGECVICQGYNKAED